MRVHHLDCGSMHPFGGSLIDGRPGLARRVAMVCHCLLVEGPSGLILVDTGLGLEDVANPTRRLGREFVPLTGAKLDASQTAARQVERLGFKRTDVRDIVVTHLDLDHAGGLSDFPEARVHVHGTEHDAAMSRRSLREKNRYRSVQWAHPVKWEKHGMPDGERWFGFDCVRALGESTGEKKGGDEVLLIPLHGHTRGHCGVAVKGSNGDDPWLLHCGDAYFHRATIGVDGPKVPTGLSVFESMIEMDHDARVSNQRRLRALAEQQGAGVKLFCAHDPIEWERLAKGTAQ
jgi:glyoxylase-like metal-dependent hydrolase (beta-lactamase superfamily II)